MLQSLPKNIQKLRGHSREVRKEAEKIKKQLESGSFYDSAPERKCVEGITIDKASSKDLDDGIWIDETDFGYSIYVSISDVAEIVKPFSVLDLDALSRATSVYLNTHTYHMFPEYISTQICSLNGGVQRFTITTQIDLDHKFNVINTSIYESIFKNIKRFDYESFNKNFNDKRMKFNKKLQLFYQVARVLNKRRISSGANAFYRDKVTLNIGGVKANNNSIAGFIIQELMLLANRENAILCYKEKINSIYRLHKPELRGKKGNFTDDHKAFYSYKDGYHFGLGENFYSHTTSPIRRYADLIHQRQIKAWLRGEKAEYNVNLVREMVLLINSRVEQILKLEKKHNKDVNRKRAIRFLKKLEVTNYETISSVPHDKFAMLIKLFSKEPTHLNSNKIIEEIVFRAKNGFLGKRQMGTLLSAPKDQAILVNLKNKILEEIY